MHVNKFDRRFASVKALFALRRSETSNFIHALTSHRRAAANATLMARVLGPRRGAQPTPAAMQN